MPSPSNDALVQLFQEQGYKDLWKEDAVVLDRVADLRCTPADPAPPSTLTEIVDIQVESREGWDCYVLCPLDELPIGLAVHLHGGAFIHEIRVQQRNALAEITRSSGHEITVPIFPLAPHATASTLVHVAAQLISTIADEAPSDRIVVLGDSAGAAIALAAAIHLRDGGSAAARLLVLMAPGSTSRSRTQRRLRSSSRTRSCSARASGRPGISTVASCRRTTRGLVPFTASSEASHRYWCSQEPETCSAHRLEP